MDTEQSHRSAGVINIEIITFNFINLSPWIIIIIKSHVDNFEETADHIKVAEHSFRAVSSVV